MIIPETYGNLHAHTENSVKDSPLGIKKYVQRAKELNMKAIAITDHGTCTGWINFLNECKTNDIKPILGVEAYVEGKYIGREHLVLLAVNRRGYIAISRIVSESGSNLVNGYPIVTKKSLKQNLENEKGNVIALSGCIQGVLAAILLANEELDTKIMKLSKRLKNYNSPDDPEFKKLLAEMVTLQEKFNKTKDAYDETKITANKKYLQKERAIKTLQNTDPETYEIEIEKLEAEKEEIFFAKESLPQIKQEFNKVKSELSKIKREIKKNEEKHKKWYEISNEIKSLNSQKRTPDELYSMAKEEADWFGDLIGHNNFFIEIQYHGLEAEKKVMPVLVMLANEKQYPIVATNDSHIAKKEDIEAMCFVRSLRFEQYNAASETDKELYIKTNEELAESLLNCGISEHNVIMSLRNIQWISDKCTGNYEIEQTFYPKYRSEDGKIAENSGVLLRAMAHDGIQKRFTKEQFNETYQKRMEYELNTIISLGYADYLLIVQDFINYGKSLSPYGIGPGRGSAAGSLVCYLLGITDIDPIPYDLLFERFLNKDRVSMPDIDTDFSDEVRKKCIDYVRNKYGAQCVASIKTQLTQAAKASIKNAGRVWGWKRNPIDLSAIEQYETNNNSDFNDLPLPSKKSLKTKQYKENQIEKQKEMARYAETISKSLPGKQGIKLNDYVKELSDKFKNNDAGNIIKMAQQTEGVMIGLGVHAAGIIISDGTPVKDIIPLVDIYDKVKKEHVQAISCDMVEAEQIGMLKMDFLGLKNLDVITNTLRLIEERYGEMPNLNGLKPDDPDVYKYIFAAGKTDAVFQFESDGMKNMLKRFKPDCFEDIVLLVAAYRPGPMQYLDGIIETKNTKRHAVTTLNKIPQIKDIIRVTYDAVVYQEQVMQIFQRMAGYTLGQSDIVRRYMSKKKHDKLAYEREAFLHGDKERGIKGCEANGISLVLANDLFDQMMDFASYAFNKSHAVAYSYVSYITAYLKHYYPAEYMCSVLAHTKTKKMPFVLNSCRQMGLNVLQPDINSSFSGFSIDQDGNIRYGLGAIKGISKAGDAIIAERKTNGYYRSFKNFLLRAHGKENVTRFLIESGAFDDIEPQANRAGLLDILEKCITLISIIKQKEEIIQQYMNTKPQNEKEKAALLKKIASANIALEKTKDEFAGIETFKLPEDDFETLMKEKELLGTYCSGHPLDLYDGIYNAIKHTDICDADIDSHDYIGIINNLRITARKKDGKEMAFFVLEDKTGIINCACFAKEYEMCTANIKEGAVVRIYGNINIEEKEYPEEDDNADEEKLEEKKLFVKKVSPVQRKRDSLLFSFENAADLRAAKEDINLNTDNDGYRLIIYLKDQMKLIAAPDNFLIKKDVKENDITGCIKVIRFKGGNI